jgi:hypothetical protein
MLLHLKPIVDADLPYPAVLVFPSWEKSLENYDSVTQEGIANLILGVFSYGLDEQFSDVPEIVDYARMNSERFLSLAEQRQLFVAPGGRAGESIDEALGRYRKEIFTLRSAKHQQQVSCASDAELVFQGIFERLTPQYHLLENADELNAQPVLPLRQQWHYFRLTAQSLEHALHQKELLDSKTIANVHALNNEKFKWLGNVPLDALVELRVREENKTFRQRMQQVTEPLGETKLADLNLVTAEVAREVASLLGEHKQEATKIQEEFDLRHKQTAVASWSTAAAVFLPVVAPILGGAAPFALAAKYGWDKLEERKAKNELSRSLLGVLAEASQQDS